MSEKVRVSVISYLNSYPFVLGLKNHSISKKIELSVDYPSACAEKLINNRADIGLIPTAAIQHIKNPVIVSDFCIGATDKVRSVVLVSDVPLESIKNVYLDFESRTSVALVKILAINFWKKDFSYFNTNAGFETMAMNNGDAMVIIGDKAMLHEKEHKYTYDLASEWYSYTGLPFVFAFWVANKELDPEFVLHFSLALEYGLSDLRKVAALAITENPELKNIDIIDYLVNNISYMVDEKKMEGYKLFSKYLKEI